MKENFTARADNSQGGVASARCSFPWGGRNVSHLTEFALPALEAFPPLTLRGGLRSFVPSELFATIPASYLAKRDRKPALSVPKNTGRKGLYRIVAPWGNWSCRGRPFRGRAAFRS